MNKIPCEVIQDLMPSYIDGLTSPVTSRVVEEHVEGCEKCRKMLEHMRQPDGTPESTTELPDRQEIDFLKKTRKRTRGVMLGSIATALVIVVLALAGKAFLLNYFGETSEKDCGHCDVCANPPRTFNGTILTQKALSAVVRTHENIHFGQCIEILRGINSPYVMRNQYNELKTFGVGKDVSVKDWQDYLLYAIS